MYINCYIYHKTYMIFMYKHTDHRADVETQARYYRKYPLHMYIGMS